MSTAILATEATLSTPQVEIKALSVSGKQMTLAVFRQLPLAAAIRKEEGLLFDDVCSWGIVRYEIKDRGELPCDLWAVMWPKGALYRGALRRRALTTKREHLRTLASSVDNLLSLPQLFIAVLGSTIMSKPEQGSNDTRPVAPIARSTPGVIDLASAASRVRSGRQIEPRRTLQAVTEPSNQQPEAPATRAAGVVQASPQDAERARQQLRERVSWIRSEPTVPSRRGGPQSDDGMLIRGSP